jgi:hypothetical protein
MRQTANQLTRLLEALLFLIVPAGLLLSAGCIDFGGHGHESDDHDDHGQMHGDPDHGGPPPGDPHDQYQNHP